jgi:hypothetical protein
MEKKFFGGRICGESGNSKNLGYWRSWVSVGGVGGWRPSKEGMENIASGFESLFFSFEAKKLLFEF